MFHLPLPLASSPGSALLRAILPFALRAACGVQNRSRRFCRPLSHLSECFTCRFPWRHRRGALCSGLSCPSPFGPPAASKIVPDDFVDHSATSPNVSPAASPGVIAGERFAPGYPALRPSGRLRRPKSFPTILFLTRLLRPKSFPTILSTTQPPLRMFHLPLPLASSPGSALLRAILPFALRAACGVQNCSRQFCAPGIQKTQKHLTGPRKAGNHTHTNRGRKESQGFASSPGGAPPSDCSARIRS